MGESLFIDNMHIDMASSNKEKLMYDIVTLLKDAGSGGESPTPEPQKYDLKIKENYTLPTGVTMTVKNMAANGAQGEEVTELAAGEQFFVNVSGVESGKKVTLNCTYKIPGSANTFYWDYRYPCTDYGQKTSTGATLVFKAPMPNFALALSLTITNA